MKVLSNISKIASLVAIRHSVSDYRASQDKVIFSTMKAYELTVVDFHLSAART